MSIADVTFSLSGITEFGGVKRKPILLAQTRHATDMPIPGVPDIQR
jgi:hypothetical protein